MRSFKLSLALCCALAALAAACARNTNTTNAGAPASNSATSQTTTTTTQTTTVTNSTNQSPAQAAPSSSPSNASGAPPSGAKKLEACELLTSDDIKAVQGEEVRESKPGQSAEGVLSASQCFFTTATCNKSVSLQVTRAADAQAMRRRWDTMFARAKEEGGKDEREKRDKDRDKDGDKNKNAQSGARGGGEEEEGGTPPVPVKGVGEEAFWAQSRFSGILYALKGDSFVRVSIGGADKPEERLRKSKLLAQKALARL
ncbi:MAG: hypothetical protein ABR563_05895 [Pyrinomonadaceae bacterium]